METPGSSPQEQVMQMKQHIDAAREAVNHDPSMYSTFDPSQQAIARGAQWGRTEYIGDHKASVTTNHGIAPDHHREGPDAGPKYDVTSAEVSMTKPNGDKVSFSTERDGETGKLVTSHNVGNRGEVLSKSDNVSGIGERVVALAAKRIKNKVNGSNLRNI